MTSKEYKQFKGLKRENLRGSMTDKELVLNMLVKLSTKEIPKTSDPETFSDHIDIAQQGGEVTRNARLELEAKTGKRVISPPNAQSGVLLKGKSEDKSKEGSENEPRDWLLNNPINQRYENNLQ